jgi:hypothetical protein
MLARATSKSDKFGKIGNRSGLTCSAPSFKSSKSTRIAVLARPDTWPHQLASHESDHGDESRCRPSVGSGYRFSGRNFIEAADAYQQAIQAPLQCNPPLPTFELPLDLPPTEASATASSVSEAAPACRWARWSGMSRTAAASWGRPMAPSAERRPATPTTGWVQAHCAGTVDADARSRLQQDVRSTTRPNNTCDGPAMARSSGHRPPLESASAGT